MLFLTKMFSVVLLSDFISGLIHWLEDVYAKPGMPLVDQIAVDNQLHHDKPRDFVKKNWFQSCWDSVLAGIIIIAAAWYFDVLSWPIILFVSLVANANQVHKWAHQNQQEKHSIVTLLQKLKLLQTPREHAKHHSGEKNTHYCVITNVLNPVLEKINFWRNLERLNHFIFGLKVNTD